MGVLAKLGLGSENGVVLIEWSLWLLNSARVITGVVQKKSEPGTKAFEWES